MSSMLTDWIPKGHEVRIDMREAFDASTRTRVRKWLERGYAGAVQGDGYRLWRYFAKRANYPVVVASPSQNMIGSPGYEKDCLKQFADALESVRVVARLLDLHVEDGSYRFFAENRYRSRSR